MLCACLTAYAGRHKYRGQPRDEVGLINNVLGCLTNKDSVSYYYLFPPFDSLWAMVIYNRDQSPDVVRDLNNLKAHPQSLLEFDPYYNHNIIARFINVVKKGEDSGIHWNNVVMQRYELDREVNTSQTLVGYDRIVPERFKGYMFVRDMLGRSTFCITITEIQKIRGYFFGGQIINILEASTVDEFIQKEADEKKYFDWLAKNVKSDSSQIDSAKKVHADSVIAATKTTDPLSIGSNDEDTAKVRREVVDRKYYEGKFDEEIPVKLFVRYMKDFKTGLISGYDGLYKFGDQVNYVKLHITKGADGKWMMEDDIPIGTMELELKNKIYTGSWTNNENQTGYDVVLTQTVAAEAIIEKLDRMLETGVYGRADEANSQPKQAKEEEGVVEGVNPPDEPRKEAEKPKPKKEKPKRKDDDED
jgi:hypothetical protein